MNPKATEVVAGAMLMLGIPIQFPLNSAFVFLNMRGVAFGLTGAAMLLPGALASCAPLDSCLGLAGDGVCVSATAGCCEGGELFSGLCPGPSDIQCCVQSGATDDSGATFGENPFYYDNWCGAEVSVVCTHYEGVKLDYYIYYTAVCTPILG